VIGVDVSTNGTRMKVRKGKEKIGRKRGLLYLTNRAQEEVAIS
jgi:hypothetical protein